MIIFGRDADEEMEPVEALAIKNLHDPYTLPVNDRCQWTVDLMKPLRPDGVIFDCTYGCNHLAKTARLLTDMVKEAIGVPCLIHDVDLPFENRSHTLASFEAFFDVARAMKGKA